MSYRFLKSLKFVRELLSEPKIDKETLLYEYWLEFGEDSKYHLVSEEEKIDYMVHLSLSRALTMSGFS